MNPQIMFRSDLICVTSLFLLHEHDGGRVFSQLVAATVQTPPIN